MPRTALLLTLLFFYHFLGAQQTLLLHSPSVSDTKIAFAYGGDIWVAGKDGANPSRLTVNPDVEGFPVISPDGKWIAFTGNYDGNADVYIISVSGGEPKRLTYHPSADIVRGWNGNNTIVFFSGRESMHPRYTKLFEVDITSGLDKSLILPEANDGNFSADGKYIAYVRSIPMSEFAAFKLYRGGDMGRIWIFNNQTHEVEEIPAAHSQNAKPVWLNNTIYFLSDRDNRRMNIYRYNLQTKQTEPVSSYTDYDVKSLYSNGKELAYEQAGKIFLLDPSTNRSTQVVININGDVPSKRPHWVGSEGMIRNINISPTGLRAVVECRGDILTIPADKGDIRNITNTTAIHERDPSWSPDGKWIAYFSDEGGEYSLKLRDQKALKEEVSIKLDSADFYYHPVWSPDSKKITYADKKRKLYVIDILERKPVEIDHDLYSAFQPQINCSWTSDSKWIAYNKRLENNLSAIFLWNADTKKSTQVTDARSEANYPAFSRDGKYLFFTASTNFGLNSSWLDMSNYEREVRSSIYAIVLSKKNPSLLNPQSDEETIKEDSAASAKTAPGVKKTTSPSTANKADTAKNAKVIIDLENIEQRIVTLAVPEKVMFNLDASVPGQLYYLTLDYRATAVNLNNYDIEKRKNEVVKSGIDNYIISSDGKKMLISASGNYNIVNIPDKITSTDGKLNMANLKVYVDPEKEWRQMFNEIWRIERDFFYVENLHGANVEAIKKKYEIFLPYVANRSDLNFVFREMLGELVIGHMYVGGGEFPQSKNVSVGLLGADYEIKDGHYSFKKIYSGLNWNRGLVAPLTEPGINVKEGEYLVAVNGLPLDAKTNLYSLFQNTAGKQTRISVNSQPLLQGAREEVVVPIPDESNLRMMNWVESNRKKVDELTGGKVAYVYLPNTGGDGYDFFNRYYFSQLEKQGVIVDERFNGGGSAADYIIDLLSRDVINYFNKRDGKPYSTPGAVIDGPKVMITNSYAGSGGDLMPFMFREKKLGKLIGTTTYGVLVGITGYPVLMDGGFVTSPDIGIFSKDGKWIIENEGVHPDIEVENFPKEVISGHDPQLEKAVEEIMKQLKPRKELKEPPAPVKVIAN